MTNSRKNQHGTSKIMAAQDHTAWWLWYLLYSYEINCTIAPLTSDTSIYFNNFISPYGGTWGEAFMLTLSAVLAQLHFEKWKIKYLTFIV